MNSQDIVIQSWSPSLLVTWSHSLRINWSGDVQRIVFHVKDNDSDYPSEDCLKCFVTLTAAETTKTAVKCRCIPSEIVNTRYLLEHPRFYFSLLKHNNCLIRQYRLDDWAVTNKCKFNTEVLSLYCQVDITKSKTDINVGGRQKFLLGVFVIFLLQFYPIIFSLYSFFPSVIPMKAKYLPYFFSQASSSFHAVTQQ